MGVTFFTVSFKISSLIYFMWKYELLIFWEFCPELLSIYMFLTSAFGNLTLVMTAEITPCLNGNDTQILDFLGVCFYHSETSAILMWIKLLPICLNVSLFYDIQFVSFHKWNRLMCLLSLYSNETSVWLLWIHSGNETWIKNCQLFTSY